ncbi:hypothetical protein [Streptomyces sp. CBMA123]|uniref:hypothetical protein n=1 Tax=Streptomyces sp. CBMA123 TaxID=1896313 RepID=UPI001661CE5E|nr:hypothetical protein [Streptomyces sp. CBMA123]MBD0694088.1 hypothetical protein [Streptomyces sp. CBMA123]
MLIKTARWGLSAAVLVVAGLALTACGPEDATSSDTPSATSVPVATSSAHSSGKPTATAPVASGQGSSSTSGGSSGSDAGHQRTLVGKLSYLAPGKLAVKPDNGGADQAFMINNATKVLGAAAICSRDGSTVTMDSQGYGTTNCTADQAETAAKTGAVTVRVTLDSSLGVAQTIAEKYHP